MENKTEIIDGSHMSDLTEPPEQLGTWHRLAVEDEDEYPEERDVRQNKRVIWLRYFLSPEASYDGRSTFLNKAASTKAAGYQCKNENSYQSLGWQIWKGLRPVVDRYFQELGLSEDSLKQKILELMHAKKTVYFSNEGYVTDSREVPDLRTQIKALKMALQVKGMLQNKNKVELTGEDGAPIDQRHGLSEEAKGYLRELLEDTQEAKDERG